MAEPVVVQPWSVFPGAKPCLARPPEQIRRGQPLVCTREKDHDGAHAVGIDGKIQWMEEGKDEGTDHRFP